MKMNKDQLEEFSAHQAIEFWKENGKEPDKKGIVLNCYAHGFYMGYIWERDREKDVWYRFLKKPLKPLDQTSLHTESYMASRYYIDVKSKGVPMEQQPNRELVNYVIAKGFRAGANMSEKHRLNSAVKKDLVLQDSQDSK